MPSRNEQRWHNERIQAAATQRRKDRWQAIQRGRDLVEYYTANEEDADISSEDFRTACVDIIADVLHTLESANLQAGFSVPSALEMAQTHYDAERS